MLRILAIVLVVFEVLGILSAVRAIMTTRTSQGAIAWTLALITWPIVAVPLYWIFGRNRFEGYVSALREKDLKVLGIVEDVGSRIAPYRVELGASFGDARVLEQLTNLPFTQNNDTKLLVNGKATFDALFAAIDEAHEYILMEFFIVNDDDVGRRLKDRLVQAVQRGCQVSFLYDELGSVRMTRKYLADLTSEGVNVSGMKTTQGIRNRFQLNFRNHRKIVVIDGKVAFIGGHNVGDEYLGGHPKLTPWRDTHMIIEGPAVLAAQLTFVEDWYWATSSLPVMKWEPHATKTANKVVFVLPSGPADQHETCGLFFKHLINCAKKRVWIATPYFVPDEGVIDALILAAMRGVDVRVLIPGLPDKRFIKMAALSYVDQVTSAGVKMYEYAPGFLHQKVVLIDDNCSVIGTANFDNRSFRLNFEVSVVTLDESFAEEVEAMLVQDFSTSSVLTAADVASKPLSVRVGSRIARLFAPIM